MSAGLVSQARRFRRRKESLRCEAEQRAALAILLGVDLDTARSASGRERVLLIVRLERVIERERLRGARHPESYNLPRHAALKQVLEQLKHTGEAGKRIKKRRRTAPQ